MKVAMVGWVPLSFSLELPVPFGLWMLVRGITLRTHSLSQFFFFTLFQLVIFRLFSGPSLHKHVFMLTDDSRLLLFCLLSTSGLPIQLAGMVFRP